MSDETFQRHEPERGPSRLDAPAPGGCCCCCCCCLHTIGGIVGGVMGSTSEMEPRPVHFRDDEEAPFPFRRDAFADESPLLPVPLLYWLFVLFLGAVTSVVTYLNHGARDPSVLIWGGVFAAMILPALQLGASLLTTVAILIFYPDREFPLRRVGRITLYSFVGTLIGVLGIAGCCGLFMLPGMMR